MLGEGLVAQREVEDARARSLTAEAALRAARARAGLAVAQRSRAALVAPIDGTVLRVFRRAGELVDGTPATPIVEIADPSTLELVSDVPAQDLVRIEVGQAGTVTLDAISDEEIAGHVTLVSPAVDPVTSLGTVRVRLDTEEHARIGMAGRASVSVARGARAVVVPRAAVRRGADGRDEVVICERHGDETRAAARGVVVGSGSGNDVEIRSGVRAGELVVADRALGLEDDTVLNVRRRPGASP